MVDAPEKSAAEFHTDMPVGEILRRGREHYGQSLEDVERNLRIRAIQLHALETGNIEQLPGKAYALGFVRSYSEYLGLDGEKMVQLFKKQSLGSRIHPSLNFPTPASESKIPSMFFALAFLVAGVVVIALWSSFDREERSEVTQVPPVSETRMAAQAPNIPSPQAAPVDSGTQSRQTPQSSQLAAPTEVERRSGDPSVTGLQSAQETQISSVEAENAPSDAQSAAQVEPEDDTDSQSQSAATTQQDQQGIILNVNENSWVEIRDMTGKAIVSRVLKAGDQYFVPDRPDLRMSLGNAVGVEIVVDGKTLPPLGRRGEVKRNIALDSASLKALAQP